MGKPGGESYCGAYRVLIESSIVDNVFRPAREEFNIGGKITVPDCTIIRVGEDYDGYCTNFHIPGDQVPYMEVFRTPENLYFDPGVIVVLPVSLEGVTDIEDFERTNGLDCVAHFYHGGRCLCILTEDNIIKVGSIMCRVGLHQDGDKKTPYIEVLSPDSISRETPDYLAMRRPFAMLACIGQERIWSHYLSCQYVPTGIGEDVSIVKHLCGPVNIPDIYVNCEIDRKFPNCPTSCRDSLREYIKQGRILSLEAFPGGLDSEGNPIGIGESAKRLGDRICRDILRLSSSAEGLLVQILDRRLFRLLMYYGIVFIPKSFLSGENILQLKNEGNSSSSFDFFEDPYELIYRIVILLNNLGANLRIEDYLTSSDRL